jgi:hypothetical protein
MRRGLLAIDCGRVTCAQRVASDLLKKNKGAWLDIFFQIVPALKYSSQARSLAFLIPILNSL